MNLNEIDHEFFQEPITLAKFIDYQVSQKMTINNLTQRVEGLQEVVGRLAAAIEAYGIRPACESCGKTVPKKRVCC